MSDVVLFTPCLVSPSGEVPRLGDSLVDEYLRFTAARVRPNTLSAQVFDLKVFFTVVPKSPQAVTGSDVLAFIEAQRFPRRGENVVRIADGEAGLAASTIKRRLATISSLFDYRVLRGLCDRNPVPRSMGARRRGHRGVPLVRAPKKLPRVLSPGEVVALTGALRTDRDRAMIALMVHGGLRRCEVLGLRFGDVHVGDRRVFVADGKGGHQRLVPVAASFFTALTGYLAAERAEDSADDHVFVVLKGPNRGRPLTAAGLDQVLAGARARAGLAHATCHELRHTCFTRLREAGMALEAIQAQAGHASIEPPGPTCTCPTTGSPASTSRPWPSWTTCKTHATRPTTWRSDHEPDSDLARHSSGSTRRTNHASALAIRGGERLCDRRVDARSPPRPSGRGHRIHRPVR